MLRKPEALGQDADSDIDDIERDLLARLRVRVREMRARGVREWGDIKLGPEPAAPLEAGKPMGDEEVAQHRRSRSLSRIRLALASSGATPTDEWLEKWERAGIGMERP